MYCCRKGAGKEVGHEMISLIMIRLTSYLVINMKFRFNEFVRGKEGCVSGETTKDNWESASVKAANSFIAIKHGNSS